MNDGEHVNEMPADPTLAPWDRRTFLTGGLGAIALGTMALGAKASGGEPAAGGAEVEGHAAGLSLARDPSTPWSALPPHFPSKVKRVIYLHMAGAPSQLELFEHKPALIKWDGKDCPEAMLKGKRFAFISGVPKLLGPQFPLHQAGQSGAWMSDRLPHLEGMIDDMCFIKSMRTDQFNHAPAQLTMQTGNARFGYASVGSWVLYGLGTLNQNLPGFIVLLSGAGNPDGGKQLWGSGYLPSVYQGVQCRSAGDPVLYLSNPSDVTTATRRDLLNAVGTLNRDRIRDVGNPETETRIAQYEMAFRMQAEATDAFDIAREPEAIRERYGVKLGESSYANNCLVARRLVERGVRFVQLYHWGWDSHGSSESESLHHGFVKQCETIDKPTAALLEDLKQSGLLEDTLVVWGGEFGRTSMRENRNGQPMKFTGRDHNPGAFTIWMAGAGVKAGMTHGETDELGYEIVRDPVTVHDFHATLMYMLGFDHHRLTFPFQGLEQKLTGVTPSRIVPEILA